MIRKLETSRICVLLVVIALCLPVPARASFLVGDIDNNNAVDFGDLLTIAEEWLSPSVCPEQGLVARWGFDEDSGNSTVDSSGAGRNGAVYGNAVWRPSSGMINGTLEFDGQDDYVEITGYKGVLGASARTCTAWIKTSTPNRDIITWGENLTGGKKWVVLLDAEGCLRVTVGGGYITASAPLTDGLWRHVAVVFAGGKTDDIELYVDGMLEGIADVKSQSVNTTAGNDVQIGVYVPFAKNFNGRIDDVRIYDYALGADEIWSIVNRGTTDILCKDLNGDGAVNMHDVSEMAGNWQQEVPPLMINEIMADNEATLSTVVRQEVSPGVYQNITVYPDWIEIFNASSQTIDLTGWSLTDNADDLTKWPFPPGTSIASGKYLIVFASKKEQEEHPDNYPYVDVRGYLHTNFNLSNNGEFLAIVDAAGTIVHAFDSYPLDDELGYPPQEEDISYGMYRNEERYFSTPTPGGANDGEFSGFADLKFSVEHGFYNEGFELELSSSVSGAQMRYTLDGSTPTVGENGTLSNSPVKITVNSTSTVRAIAFKSGYQPSDVETQTYIFVSDVVNQSPNGESPGPGWPAYSINGQAIDYGMDPDITQNNSQYKDLVDDALLAIPSFSIVTDLYNLFDPAKGIYVRAREDGRDWERPASIELIHPDGTKGFQINGGIRIRGGFSRSGNNPKHAFRLFFRSEYGQAKLRYPLFGDEGVDEFDNVDLRTSQNYSWSFQGDSRNVMVREVFQRDAQRQMGQPYTRSRYYHLYLNGHYWGLFQTQERSEASFGESYFGGDKEDYDVIKHSSRVRIATDGNLNAFNQLFNYAMSGFSSNEAYYRVLGMNADGTPNPGYNKLVDVDGLIVYMLGIFFSGDKDAPISNFMGNSGLNNFYCMYNRVNPDGFKFFRHDGEHTLTTGMNDRTGPWNHSNFTQARYFNPQTLHQKLIAHPEYKMRFADLAYKVFFNRGVFTEKGGAELIMERANQIDLAIIAESARWGDAKQGSPFTKAHWQSAVNAVLSYFKTRKQTVINQLIHDGWYPTVEPAKIMVDGEQLRNVQIEPTDTLTMTASAGTIYYTTDGTDPREPVADIAPGLKVTLVQNNASKKVLIPTGDIGTDWRGGSEPYPFDEPGWISGTGGVGYETNTGYENYFDIDVQAMRGVTNSCYVRIPFNVDPQNRDKFVKMTLKVRYDDGFVAYLNGAQIASANPPAGTPVWNSSAGGTHSDGQAVNFADFNVTDHLQLLRSGTNVLAVHALNAASNQSDFLISVKLIAEGAQTGGSTGGGVSLFAKNYNSTGAFTLDKSSHIKARVLSGNTWSPLQEVVYAVGNVADNLRITEILYHPQAQPDGHPDAEFIELTNIGDNPINLDLVRFSEGVDFTFDDLQLGPGKLAVVVKDTAVFEAQYPSFAGIIAGEYEGSLDNGGEKIKLVDAIGRFILEADYKDGWFDITDGDGFSLTVRDARRSIIDHVDNGLAGHWKLDEASGPDVHDSSPNNRDGVSVGDPVPMPADGQIDGAFYFDGDGDTVEITGYEGILGSAARTCSAWIKTYTPYRHIVSWGLGGPAGAKWIFALGSRGELFVGIGAGNMYGSTPLTDGKWHHVAAVFKGAGTEDIQLYLDGRPEPVGSMVSQVVDTTSGNVVEIGGYSGRARYFDGLIDNVSIYDRALSVEEVEALAADDKYWSDKKYWRPGAAIGGSPGRDDTGDVPRLGDVVINEILAHAHDVESDWIELHNTTDSAINIGGWFLSDDKDDYTRYEIAPDTWIPADGYIVFKENETFGDITPPIDPGRHTPFALSENGETLYVRSGRDHNGDITGYYEEEVFGASERNVAFGRYLKSTGAWNFVPMSQNTPGPNFEGAPNADPKTGPVVISEIMYHPTGNPDAEYIELCNVTGDYVGLFDYVAGASGRGWQVEGISDFEILYYGQPLLMLPYERLLLVKDLDAFNSEFTAAPNTRIIEWEKGSLDNGGEKITLSKPGDLVGSTQYYVRVDRVVYDDENGWPRSADGGSDVDGNGIVDSISLNRIVDTEYGNDIVNWRAATPSPGAAQ